MDGSLHNCFEGIFWGGFAIKAEDLLAIAAGQLNPQEAVAQGRLLLAGNMKAVLQANRFLELLFAEE